MDTTATDFAVDAAAGSDDINFPLEIAKTLVLSAATTAGMIVGLGAVAYGYEKYIEVKKARRTKKNDAKDLSEKTPANKN